MLFDDEPKKPVARMIGQDLSAMSIEDLEEYVGELEAEIERVKADADQKKRQRQGAEALFRR